MEVINKWREFYELNEHLLSERTRSSTKNYLTFSEIIKHQSGDYDNYFRIDGASEKEIKLMLREFVLHKTQLSFPALKSHGKTIFFADAEGWCSDSIFESLHLLIDLFGLTGECYYRNCSINAKELYYNFCSRNQTPQKLTCIYKNVAFLSNAGIRFYPLPIFDTPPPILSLQEKKLFTSLNWNNWTHRQALVAMLNYHDLIEYGNVSSPTSDIFNYSPDKDYELLHISTEKFFMGDDEQEKILNKLPDIRKNYPLVIDDRTLYKTVDVAITNSKNITHTYMARDNGLFELISETLCDGPLFFSEKTYWAMFMKKPFLLFGSYKSLQGLKRLGFKTFDPYIDESYDNISNTVDRLKAIMLELMRLKELRENDPDKFYANYEKMIEISEHNRKLFLRYIKTRENL
jgi:hypothetical protein